MVARRHAHRVPLGARPGRALSGVVGGRTGNAANNVRHAPGVVRRRIRSAVPDGSLCRSAHRPPCRVSRWRRAAPRNRAVLCAKRNLVLARTAPRRQSRQPPAAASANPGITVTVSARRFSQAEEFGPNSTRCDGGYSGRRIRAPIARIGVYPPEGAHQPVLLGAVAADLAWYSLVVTNRRPFRHPSRSAFK